MKAANAKLSLGLLLGYLIFLPELILLALLGVAGRLLGELVGLILFIRSRPPIFTIVRVAWQLRRLRKTRERLSRRKAGARHPGEGRG